MTPASRRGLAALAFAAALAGFFCYHSFSNDHFDRIARARQIAAYGDVPFRDFYDPGYFLTLYTSAALQRVLGDNLLGEALLNVSFMAAGATLVFLMVSRVTGSILWGLLGLALTIAAEPRPYDYDKMLFYPLALYVCWRYADRPSWGRLGAIVLTGTIAALFRYDSGVYIGAAAVVTIAVRHWGEWRAAAVRLAAAALLAAIVVSPAVVFVARTAGLGEAYRQVSTYARKEGERSGIFRMSRFDVNWTAPFVRVNPSDGKTDLWSDVYWFEGFNKADNAAAWLHWLAVLLPGLTLLLGLLNAANRNRAAVTRLAAYAVLAELVALFILRNPVTARVGAVMPIVFVGLGMAIGEWRQWARRVPSAPPAAAQATALAAVGVVCLVTGLSLWALLWYPPKSNIHFARRIHLLAQTPPSLALMPKPQDAPLVEYIRACTKPSDAFFEPWFAGELYFFSQRAFAGGLPVVFGDHWAEETYQRRSIERFARQSVPLVITSDDELSRSHDLLWAYIVDHYDRGQTVKLGDEAPPVTIWTERGRTPERLYGPFGLPCFANGD